MTVHLAPITKVNWERAAELNVREDQAQFVASNLYIIAETRWYPWTQLRGVYDGGEMVGFLAFGRDPDDDELWLYRYMIDRSAQGRGYGRAGLLALIEELRHDPANERITVGYKPDNAPAEALYLSVGFEPAAPAPWGESTAMYTFSR